MMFRSLVNAASVAVLAGCTSINYADLEPGQFSGDLIVMWVAEGNSVGDGKFLFLPDPRFPLTFQRHNPRLPGASLRPGIMYTDGGSIPKIGQLFNGFSPWGYAPAYMIHDWIFVARHCIVDGDDNPRFNDVKGVSFEDSATILGEAIVSLVASGRVKRNDLAGSAITTAVGSFVSRGYWDMKGACSDLEVDPRDVAAAAEALPSISRSDVLKAFGLPATYKFASPTSSAKIVARIEF